VRVFEAGRVFKRDTSVQKGAFAVAGVAQPMRLAGLAYGSADETQWAAKERAADFFDIKGDIEALLAPRVARFVADEHPALHPGARRVLSWTATPSGLSGASPPLAPGLRVPVAPLMFELDLEALKQADVPAFQPIPRSSRRGETSRWSPASMSRTMR